MTLDGELLRRYTEAGSEEAFAELVRRHLDLVYSAALRQVNGDVHLAQDVAQTVFTELARNAPKLAERRVLTGWLYTCSHFAAAKAVRTERRRCAREQEAQAMDELLPPSAPDFEWETLRPVLDRLMHELNEADREAILLRYFENLQLADIGNRLGLSEDAARNRVDRALEKLRGLLGRKGITATATLGTVLSVHAVQVAPAGLAAALASASVASAAAGAGTTLTLIKLVTMSKLQASILGAVIVAGVATPLVIQHNANVENQALRQQLEQQSQLQADNDRLSNLLAQANSSQALRHDEQLSELLRLRGEVGGLRNRTNELGKLAAENQRLRQSLATATPKSGALPQTLPRESWAFAGYADPESAFQSAIWAMSQDDAKTFLASLAPDGPLFKELQGRSESEVIAQNKSEIEKVKAFKILDKETISEDETVLTIFAQGVNEAARFRMQRVGNDWKFAGPIKGGGPPAAPKGTP